MRIIQRASILAGVLVLLTTAVQAAPEQHYIGEPWERAIDRGVVEQRQAIRRGTAPKQLVERALRATRRNDGVDKLYLLARAYGVHAQWHRAKAKTARGPASKQRHLAEAANLHAEAMATYAAVIKRAPRCYYAMHDMGVLVLQNDEKAKRGAFDHFRNAYRTNARYLPTLRQLITMYLAEKQFGVAVPLLQGLLAEAPGDDEARARLVASYTSLEKYPEAYRILDPMIAKRPGSPTLMALRADLDRRSSNFKRAISTYQRISRMNPNVPTGFLGLIQVVEKQRTEKLEPDLKAYRFGLKGLMRIERDPEQRKALAGALQRVEHQLANPGGASSTGPATIPQLLHALKSPDGQVRWNAVVGLLTHEEKPSPETVRALASRLSASVEPEPPVRAAVVRGLGLLSGSRLAPLLRHSIADANERVRIETIDTLADIGRRDLTARGSVIAILGLSVEDKSVELAAAARNGILALTDTRLEGLDEDSDDAAYRQAFRSWWQGPIGTDVQIRALEAYPGFGDRTPHLTLAPYLASNDFYVWKAAYEAFGACAKHVRDPALRPWCAARPQFAPERLQKANWPALKGEMAAWLAARPAR
ncbi:MAG: HEAT repeat domain-containing protein [Planctomycetota bacterium]|nr:HEAT repeat domain-containing protein [Planctomycetota bacterium]